MTREESINLAKYEETPYYFQSLINKIYDEFNLELEALENRSCNNCRNSSFEVKFGELEFNACFLVSNGNICKWESK